MKKQCILLILFFNIYAAIHPTLLFIDTGLHDQYIYNDLLIMLEAGGLSTEYAPLHQVKNHDLDDYQALMIAIDPIFLSALLKKENANHPLITSYNKLINGLKTINNKTICLLMPANSNKTAVGHYFNHLMQKTLAASDNRRVIDQLAKNITYLSESDKLRSSEYDTALFDKQQQKPLAIAPCTIKDDNKIIAATIPFDNHQPLAFYLFNKAHNNHYFIAKTSLLNCSGLKENFVYYPMNKKLREARLKSIFNTINLISQTALLDTLCTCFNPHQSLPYQFTEQFEKQQYTAAHDEVKIYNSTLRKLFNNKKIVMGWADLKKYDGKEDQAAATIISSGINLLWFELNPEWYLSKRAIAKNKKQEFFNSINRFTKALQQQARKQGKKPPTFVMGTDITSNFRSAPVHIPARDIFGKTYSKIPAPLDFEQFWQPELLEVFDNFIHQWPKIGNGLPLAGVFLDLEMYHAQDQTAQYSNFMDFSDNALNTYLRSKKIQQQLTSPLEQIHHIIKQDMINDYQTVLQKQAYLLGKRIRAYIKSKLPHALIGVYNIAPPNSWFYQGLLSGLGTKNDPLLLATFNFNYYKHYPWLSKHSIYAFHLPVMLLSKFKSPQDFDKVPPLAKNNDGIWLNKISRLEESRNPKDWNHDYRVEVTPLPTKTFTKHLKATLDSLDD